MLLKRTGAATWIIALGLMCSLRAAPPATAPVLVATNSSQTTLIVSFKEPLLYESDAGTRIQVEDCLSDVVPGAPALPFRSLTVAIPPGARPRSITVTPGRTTTLSLKRPVAPAEEPVALSAGRQL